LCYILAANLTLKLEDKLDLLETTDPIALLEKVLELLTGEIEIIRVDKKIQNRIKKNVEKSQKEYYLTEQMEAIQRELGGKEDGTEELEESFKKAKEKGMSKEATEKVTKELKKLRSMSPISAESAVSRNYIELLCSLPWNTLSKENRDIKAAEVVIFLSSLASSSKVLLIFLTNERDSALSGASLFTSSTLAVRNATPSSNSLMVTTSFASTSTLTVASGKETLDTISHLTPIRDNVSTVGLLSLAFLCVTRTISLLLPSASSKALILRSRPM